MLPVGIFYLGEVSLASPPSQHLSLHHQIAHIQLLLTSKTKG